MPKRRKTAVPTAIPIIQALVAEEGVVGSVAAHLSATPSALRLLKHLVVHAEAATGDRHRHVVDWPPDWAQGDPILKVLSADALEAEARGLLSTVIGFRMDQPKTRSKCLEWFTVLELVGVEYRHRKDGRPDVRLSWSFAETFEQVLAEAGPSLNERQPAARRLLCRALVPRGGPGARGSPSGGTGRDNASPASLRGRVPVLAPGRRPTRRNSMRSVDEPGPDWWPRMAVRGNGHRRRRCRAGASGAAGLPTVDARRGR